MIMERVSEKEASVMLQGHELILFKVDQKVRMKKRYEKINNALPIEGYINSIKISRNGILYEVIYRSNIDGLMKSRYFLSSFIEHV